MSKKVIIDFLGDIGLNRLYCDDLNHVFLRENMAEISKFLGIVNLRIANWEAPIQGDGGVNLKKNPRLFTTEKASECILPLRLNVALLANNHIYDCLGQGFHNTLSFLEKNQIKHIGAGKTAEECKGPLILELNGIRIGLLNYMGAETHPNIPEDSGVFVNFFDLSHALEETSRLAGQSDAVIVNLHWGDEFVRFPAPWQRKAARQIIDAGAKMVVCHHSHNIQGFESWHNGRIFYGLGNFIFCGLDGWKNDEWPHMSQVTAVIKSEFSESGLESAEPHFLKQTGLWLKRDNSIANMRLMESLSNPLLLDDRAYEKFYRVQMKIRKIRDLPLIYIHSSGGFAKAARRITERIFGNKEVTL
jgi:hypothetical protein